MKKITSVLMTISLLAAMGNSVLAMPITKNTTLNGVMGIILGIVQAIAFAFATGMLLYIGIKYTMASANEKADLKKGSISYVIGAVIIFAATGLLEVAKQLGEDFNNVAS